MSSCGRVSRPTHRSTAQPPNSQYSSCAASRAAAALRSAANPPEWLIDSWLMAGTTPCRLHPARVSLGLSVLFTDRAGKHASHSSLRLGGFHENAKWLASAATDVPC